MFGVWRFTASSETKDLEQIIEQAYEVWEYSTIIWSDFTQYESLDSNAQEQILLSLIKSNELETVQSLISRTTNPSVNTRLYNKLVTFTLQEDRDAVERVATAERTNIASIRAVLFYYRSLVAYHTRDYDIAQILLEQSLSLDALAGATHLLGAKIITKIEYRPWATIDSYINTAYDLWAKLDDEDRYDLATMYFYTGRRELIRETFDNISNKDFRQKDRFITLWRVALESNEYEEAIELFEDAKKSNVDDRVPYLWIWRVFAKQEKFDEAKKAYEQWLQRSSNWEILADLVRVYDKVWDDDQLKILSYRIEQTIWSNVWNHAWILRRFIEIYEPNYLKKYADETLKKYSSWRFDREEADKRYENSLKSLYTTIQESYITLMVNRWFGSRPWDWYRDTLISMQNPSEMNLIYTLLAYEREWDGGAIERIRPLLASIDKRKLWLIRIFNRIYLWEYTWAARELTSTVDELTDLDVLWLSWKIREDQWSVNSDQALQLTQLLEATNEDQVSLERWFEIHFASITWKIRKFYPPVEN